MPDKTAGNILKVITAISLLLGLLGTTSGWVRKAISIETDMLHIKSDIARVCNVADAANAMAIDNNKESAVIKAEIRSGFGEIMRRLDRLER